MAHGSRKHGKTTNVVVSPEPAELPETTIPTETGITPEPVEPVKPVEPVVEPFVAGTYRITDPDGTAFDVPITPTLARVANAVRAVATVPADAPDRWTAIVDAVRAAYNVHGEPVDFTRVMLNRSPWGGNVTETQNALYAALIMARVPVSSADVTAVWRAMLPVTKCDFRSHVDYGFSTFALFVRAAHGNMPTGIPSGPWFAVAGRWYALNGFRKPDAWTVNAVSA